MAAPSQYSLAGIPNHALDATISATTIKSGSSANNVKNGSMYARVLKSAAASADWELVLDLGSSKTVGIASLWGTNLSDSATVEWEHDDNAGFSSPTSLGVESPFASLMGTGGVSYTPPFGRPAIHVLSTPTADRYWRVSINDTGNADSEYQIAYALLGELRTPTTGPPVLTQDYMMSSPRGVDFGWRRHRVTFEALTESEREMYMNLAGSVGRTGIFAAIPRPDTPAAFVQEALLCTLASAPSGHTAGPPTSLVAAAKPASAGLVLEEVYY